MKKQEIPKVDDETLDKIANELRDRIKKDFNLEDVEVVREEHPELGPIYIYKPK